jgi:hypothetical protein
VGPQEFRRKLLTRNNQPLRLDSKPQSQPQAEEIPFNQTQTSKNGFATTINRNTMYDSLHKDQQIQFTKQTRNL